MPPRLRLAEESDPLGPARSAKESISVVLADDHCGVRRTIRALLDGEDGFEVVAEVGDMEAVGRELTLHRPRVLVLDLGIADVDGARTGPIATIRSLRAQAPATEIVVVTVSDSPAFAKGALAAGAVAFVLKDLADSDLPHAIREAAVGRKYVSPRVWLRMGPRPGSGIEPGMGGKG